jgi:hypothetical protein
MSQYKEKFVALLEELFQLNQPELDFGLYRILHARSRQIKAFIQNELSAEIDKVFAGQYQTSVHDQLHAARLKIEQTLGDYALEANGDIKPEFAKIKIGQEYEAIRQQAQQGGGLLADDAQIYDHLYRFFSRYYDKGDFMSRRYFVAENDSRALPYAIPYDGREVMLHWANKDQYYIKSSEYLANFTVDLAAAQKIAGQGGQAGFDFAAPAESLTVHFRLAAASEGEHNNVKEGQERYFLIHSPEPVKLETNAQGQTELVIQFQYRPDPEKTGQAGTWQQKRLNEAEAAIQAALADLPEAEAHRTALATPAPTDKQPNRTLLGKYLGQYTSRNTMDYFIHKNLGGFLRRELDFYIKNEIMRLDDIENAEAPRVESYLKKLQSLRKIARRIIDFLAQIEDFQKKLWLKKKFLRSQNERDTLSAVLDMVFGKENRIEELIWAQNTTHSQSPLYSTNHEYIEVYAKDRGIAERLPAMFREPKPGLKELLELVTRLNKEYPPIADVRSAIKQLYEEHLNDFKQELEQMGLTYNEETKKQDPWRGLYNYDGAEYRNENGIRIDEECAREARAKIWVFRESDPSAPAQKQSESTKDPNDPNYRYYVPNHPITGRPCSIPRRGWAWPLTWPDHSRESFQALDRQGRIIWGNDESKIPQFKRFAHNVETNVAKSFFHDYTDGEKQIAALFGEQGLFPTPKPTTLPIKLISQTTGETSLVLDFFGGSGTTGHAVIDINRQTGGQRKFILVEMSNYFDQIMLNRLKKTAFTPEWMEGLPKRLPSLEEAARSPKVFKVLRLESYEDTLNNLLLPKNPVVDVENPQNSDLARDYLLKYWLDFETAGSPSLLNVRQFADPTAYRLKVKQPGSDAQVEKTVDLIETFNWLIGLHVAQLDRPRRYAAELVQTVDPDLPKDQDTRWTCARIDEQDEGEFWFRWVEGHVLAVPGDETSRQRVLVLWRKLTSDAGRDQAVLEAYLAKKKLNPLESEFETIYINGSHALPSDGNAATRVRLIEETFAQRMWEDACNESRKERCSKKPQGPIQGRVSQVSIEGFRNLVRDRKP